jgi:predicted MFS family arabinose efflux permease
MLSDPRRLAVAFAGLCSFINLYATQPLLPQFAREFGASEGEVSMTVSATTFAVALVAPFIGVVADVVGRKRIIAGALALLVVPTLLLALSHSLTELIVWRFVQGLLLPPIFAVTVAYIGDEWPDDEIAGVTGVYVAASAVGGFLGRFLSGLVADHAGWRDAFWVLAAVTAVSAVYVAVALPRERGFVRAENVGHSVRLMLGHFLNPPIVATFAVGFTVLFSFVATFTYVNFYLGAPPFELSASALGAIFVIYLLAVVVTPRTGRWIRAIGRRRLVVLAVAMSCVGLSLTLIRWLPVIMVGLGLASMGGFICQTSATGLLAQRATAARSSAVGLYVSFYYIGGSMGAAVPALFWARAGWPGCVALVILALLGMAALVLRFWRNERPGAA